MNFSKNKFIFILISVVMVLSLGSCGNKYALTFETNGGNTIDAVSFKKSAKIDLPTPTKDGYEFVGWYTSKDFSGEPVTEVSIKNNATVYAKWEQLFAVTLDFDGGSASQNVVYGKVGDNIYNLVKDIIPTKEGLTFGAWFVNGNELTNQTKLTSKGATLKARYKVEYTINVYKQKTTLDGYDLETKVESAYVNTKVNVNYDIEGMTEVDKVDSVTEITLNADKTKNILNVYYDREKYTITFRSNFPVEGMEPLTTTINAVYGEKVEIPQLNYACNGYYLLGWALSADGELVYDAHYIDNLAYNREEDVEVVMDKFDATRTMSLYAVWNVGYRDMFGGDDYIFVADEKTIYLCRGGVYFLGKLKAGNTFTFTNDADTIVGKIFDDHTFAYSNTERDEYNATLYKVGTGLDENVKIFFDLYNGITFSVKGEDGTTVESNGTYVITDEGYFVATFEDGTFQGQTLTLLIGTVTVNGEKVDAFQLRNEEEFGMGELVRFGVNNGQLSYFTIYQLILTGFGQAAFNSGNGASYYYYTYDSETKNLVLSNSNGQQVMIAKVFEVNGKLGYMVYDETLAQTYVNEDGSTLTLDGMVNATYVKGDETITGYYTLTKSIKGDYIVKFTSGGKNYTFLTSSHTEEREVVGEETVEGEEPTYETVTIYTFEKKLNGYAEFYYQDGEGIYYAPLIVINDKKEGFASIYGYTTSKTYELVLEGPYVYDETTKHYTFVTQSVYEAEVLTSPFNIAKIKNITFNLDTDNTNYQVSYWFNVTLLNDSEEETSYEYEVKYTSESGAKLSIVGSIAIFEKDGIVVIGTFATKEGLTTITAKAGSVYVELDTENKTFVVLEHAPYNAYIVAEDGTYSSTNYLSLDGKGNGEYFYVDVEEVENPDTHEMEEQRVKKSYKGTVTKLEDTTKQGSYIFKFESPELTFNYITVSTSSAQFVFRNYGNYSGTYTSADGILELDGFGYYASYTDKDGVELTGIYSVSEENVVRVILEQKYRYFDLNGKSFTARGTEYGTYILFDNQGAPGEYIELNGYGVVKVYKTELDAEENVQRIYFDENGSYTVDGDKFTLNFKKDTNDVTYVGFLGTYTYGQNVFNTFVIEHQEVVKTFINTKNWTILKLDAKGGATLIDKNGNENAGTYMLITDSLLYFVNDAATDANIFKYNFAKGTIVESEFTARGYYTSDLKSLLFSEYGFAIFNNETRYYYTMEGNDVIIYRQDAENPEANQYGFVSENFGEFDDVKNYKGDTYYMNDGYAIIFSRVEATKNNYPVKVSSNDETLYPLENLTFTPPGSAEFRVAATIQLNGTSYNCYVIRELVDEEYVMYINVGAYKFYINATYTGKDADGRTNSTYEVTSMVYENMFYPYSYLDTYYLLYSFLGPNYANSYSNGIGMIYNIKTFDESGEILEDYIKVDFFETSGIVDLMKAVLNADHAAYEFNEKSGLYSVDLTATDGYTYRLHFQLKNHRSFNMAAFSIYAVTRVESFTDGDYAVEVERIMISESGYNPGTLFAITLKENDTEVTYTEVFTLNDVLYYVSREIDEESKQILATYYYALNLVTENEGSVEEDENVVKPYKSCTVTKYTANTYYDEEGKQYVDVVDGKVVFIATKGNKYIVRESEFDAETNTYTITYNNKSYKVSLNEENKITITEVVVEETTEE